MSASKSRKLLRFLSLFLVLSLLCPVLCAIPAGAERLPAVSTAVPKSGLLKLTRAVADKAHSLTYLFAILKLGAGTVYAVKHSNPLEDPVKFFSTFSAYITGNAALLEIEKLKSWMQQEFAQVRDALEEVKLELNELKDSIAALSTKIDELTITKFLTDYLPKLQNLQNAYDFIDALLQNQNADDAQIKRGMDNLYQNAKATEGMVYYLTGSGIASGKDIMHLYADYVAESADPEEVTELVDAFCWKLYQADTLRRYCLQLSYIYQMGYLEKNGATFYNVDNSLESFSMESYVSLLESLGEEKNQIDVCLQSIIAQNYAITDTLTYEIDGRVYSADLPGEKPVYPGVLYYLPTIPGTYDTIFDGPFSFRVSDPALASVTSDGKLYVIGTEGAFTVSCLYAGEAAFTMDFTIGKMPLGGGYGQKTAPYLITTPEQFRDFSGNAAYRAENVYTVLLNDLDMTDIPAFTALPFSGVFNGNNYAIRALSVTDGAFGNTVGKNGEVKNLVLEGLTAALTGKSTNLSAGAVCGTNNGAICNVAVANSSVSAEMKEIKSSSCRKVSASVGGIAGTNAGTIRFCSVKNCTLSGNSNGKITFGSAKLNDSDSFYSTASVGGIVGTLNSSGTISDCFAQNDGGISCTARCSSYCWKELVIGHHKDHKGNATANAGGIAGYAEGGTLCNCVSEGSIPAPTAASAGTENNNYDLGNCSSVSVSCKTTSNPLANGSIVVTDCIASLSGMEARQKATFALRGWQFTETSASVHTLPEEVTLVASPAKTSYRAGDEFNPAGMYFETENGEALYGFEIADLLLSAGDDGKEVSMTVHFTGETLSLNVAFPNTAENALDPVLPDDPGNTDPKETEPRETEPGETADPAETGSPSSDSGDADPAPIVIVVLAVSLAAVVVGLLVLLLKKRH